MDQQAAQFEKSAGYSFESLKAAGNVAFPTLAALIDPPMSVVPPAGGSLYLQPGVLPPARDLFDKLVDLANRKKEETIWDLLRPTSVSPSGTNMEKLQEEAEITIIEGKHVVSIPVGAVVSLWSAAFKGTDPGPLPETPVFLRGTVPNRELILSIDKTPPYLAYERARTKALADMDAFTVTHFIFIASLTKPADDAETLKSLADLYEVDVDRIRKNRDIADEATDLAPALREATLPVTLKLAWLPSSESREKIRDEMARIAKPALELGTALAQRVSALLSRFDLKDPMPAAAPQSPPQEGSGSIRV